MGIRQERPKLFLCSQGIFTLKQRKYLSQGHYASLPSIQVLQLNHTTFVTYYLIPHSITVMCNCTKLCHANVQLQDQNVLEAEKMQKFVTRIHDELATLLAMYMGVVVGKPSPDSRRPISSGVRGQLPFMRKFSGLYWVLLTPLLRERPPTVKENHAPKP